MFLFIISTNKEYAEWPAPRQNNKKRENAAGHVTDLQPSFNNTPTQAIMHVYQIMKTIIIYTKKILNNDLNLPIMSIVAASTPVAAVATTTTATAIVSRPVTTAAAIVPNEKFECTAYFFSSESLFWIYLLKIYKMVPRSENFYYGRYYDSWMKWVILVVYDVITFIWHYYKLTSAYDYSYYHSRIEVSLTVFRRDIKILKRSSLFL